MLPLIVSTTNVFPPISESIRCTVDISSTNISSFLDGFCLTWMITNPHIKALQFYKMLVTVNKVNEKV